MSDFRSSGACTSHTFSLWPSIFASTFLHGSVKRANATTGRAAHGNEARAAIATGPPFLERLSIFPLASPFRGKRLNLRLYIRQFRDCLFCRHKVICRKRGWRIVCRSICGTNGVRGAARLKRTPWGGTIVQTSRTSQWAGYVASVFAIALYVSGHRVL